MKKIVTLGELLLRLTPPKYLRINQTNSFDVAYGGSEANVAASLSYLGISSRFLTALPKNQIGHSAIQFLRRHNIDTDAIVRNDNRMGVYFCEKGYSIRPSKVLYDRKWSAFYESKVEDYDLEKAFNDANWFHFSGITPALNKNLYNLTKKAVEEAKKKGLIVSCDLNFRSSLWDLHTAREAMSSLMKNVDVCIGIEPLNLLNENGEDIKDVNNILPPYDFENISPLLKEIKEAYNFKYIALTRRNLIGSNTNILECLLYDGDKIYRSDKKKVINLDRVGGGDAFAAGLLYGLMQGWGEQKIIEFANASFALKHTIQGDINDVTLEEVMFAMKHSNIMDVQR